VRATRNSEFSHESAVPTSFANCRCDVDDPDDFQDGDYELEFDGRKLTLSKKQGNTWQDYRLIELEPTSRLATYLTAGPICKVQD
jgi:hypothetical protein